MCPTATECEQLLGDGEHSLAAGTCLQEFPEPFRALKSCRVALVLFGARLSPHGLWSENARNSLGMLHHRKQPSHSLYQHYTNALERQEQDARERDEKAGLQGPSQQQRYFSDEGTRSQGQSGLELKFLVTDRAFWAAPFLP